MAGALRMAARMAAKRKASKAPAKAKASAKDRTLPLFKTQATQARALIQAIRTDVRILDVSRRNLENILDATRADAAGRRKAIDDGSLKGREWMHYSSIAETIGHLGDLIDCAESFDGEKK